MRHRPLALLFAAALLACAVAVSAEETGEIPNPEVGPVVTDRPTDSASPLLVPRHMIQFEMGYKFSRLDTATDRVDTQELPELLVRYGINKRVEARLFTTGWSFSDGSTGKKDGLTDVTLGAKIALAEERGRRPQMALLADLSMPVGHSEVTNDYVIPKVLFLGSSTLTDRLGLTYNMGPSFVTTKNDSETQHNTNLNYAVALSGSVGGPVSLFGEVFGNRVFGRDSPDSHTFQAGATILLSRNVQIDFRGGLGVVDNVPDWLVGAGLAFRLPL